MYCNMCYDSSSKTSKNKTDVDYAYWVLKYAFNKKYTDNLKNSEKTKILIFDILKYVHIVQTPTINNLYSRNN